MEIKDNIAATLHEEMERRDLSIEKFAKLLTIAKTSLQNYLNGAGNPSLRTMELMAEKLGLSMEELLFRRQRFDSFGRTALNSIPDEIQLLHPSVQDVAERQFFALQALYDLSDGLDVDESLEEIFSGGRRITP